MIRALVSDRPLMLRLAGLALVMGLQWVIDACADELEKAQDEANALGVALRDAAEDELALRVSAEAELLRLNGERQLAQDLHVQEEAAPPRPPCRPCREAAAAGHEIRCRCSERLRQWQAGQQVEALMAQLPQPDGAPNLRLTEQHQEQPAE